MTSGSGSINNGVRMMMNRLRKLHIAPVNALIIESNGVNSVTLSDQAS